MAVLATFFPYSVPIHLHKDVGMIPRILARDRGYRSIFVSYENPALLEEARKAAPELELSQIGQNPLMKNRLLFRLFGKLDPFFIGLDLVPFMFRRASEIDILNSYSIRYTYIVGLVYKLFNRKGLVYCKWDKDPAFLDDYEKNSDRTDLRILSYYLLLRFSPIDIISAESKEVCAFFSRHPLLKKVAKKLIYVPNGVETSILPKNVDFEDKESIILHVGRTGTHQKATEILLDAFAGCEEAECWRLALIGGMEGSFKPSFDAFLKAHPDAAKRINHLGFVEKETLHEYYRKAKILAMPSRYESFGLVVVEAGLFGAVLVGSDIQSFREITDGGRLGYLCPVDDADCLSKRLAEAIADRKALAEKSSAMAEHVREGYDWRNICAGIDGALKAALARKS